jgi:hypothetical protein
MQPHRAGRMPTDLSETLMEHSPRLVISRPTLIRVADSPTGWLVVVPGTDDDVADAEERRRTRTGNPGGPVQGALRS